MNAISILFLSLVAVVSSRVPVKSYPPIWDQCERAGPEVYCSMMLLIKLCDAETKCEEYWRKSPCEKGPKIYCQSDETAQSCKKADYCLTWPDDSVIAIAKRPDRNHIFLSTGGFRPPPPESYLP